MLSNGKPLLFREMDALYPNWKSDGLVIQLSPLAKQCEKIRWLVKKIMPNIVPVSEIFRNFALG